MTAETKDSRKPISSPWKTAWKALLIIAALIMLFFARGALLNMLLIVLPAAVLAFVLLPLQRVYERRLNPGLAAVLSLLSLLIPLAALVWLSIPSITSQASTFSKKLPELFEYVSSIAHSLSEQAGGLGIPADNLPDFGVEMLGKLTEGTQSIINGVFAGIASAGKYFLSPIVSFYMLKDRKKLADFSKRMIPAKNRGAVVKFFMDVSKFLSEYLKKQLLISLITATLTAIGLAIVGLDAFLFLGVVMGIFNLIPYFGPFLGMIPIALFSLMNGIPTMLWSLLAAFIVQQIESVLITPRLLSDTSGFHPAVVILLMIFGGDIFGLWGMLLVVPAASIIKSAYISFTNTRLYRGTRL